jgi:hypothetical protein
MSTSVMRFTTWLNLTLVVDRPDSEAAERMSLSSAPIDAPVRLLTRP